MWLPIVFFWATQRLKITKSFFSDLGLLGDGVSYMSVSAGKNKSFLILGILDALAGVLVILAITVAAFFFNRYRQAGKLHFEAMKSRVFIPRRALDSRLFPVTVRRIDGGLQV
jgi:hypothetical protein